MVPGSWILDFRFWILDFRFFCLDVRVWTCFSCEIPNQPVSVLTCCTLNRNVLTAVTHVGRIRGRQGCLTEPGCDAAFAAPGGSLTRTSPPGQTNHAVAP